MNYVNTKILLALAVSIITPACLGFGYPSQLTPLMQALESKQPPQEIKRLIEQGEDVNAVDIDFLRCIKPVLRYALDRGTDKDSVTIIKMLIKAGSNVNDVTYNRVANPLYGMMPLLTYAAIYSSAEVVQILVDAGARNTVLEDHSMNFGKTALMVAHERGNADVIKVLTGTPFQTSAKDDLIFAGGCLAVIGVMMAAASQMTF